MYKYIVLVTVLFGFIGCSPAPRYTSKGVGRGTSASMGKFQDDTSPPMPGMRIKGFASFYADDYHGRKTSNGEVYDMYGLTCAHRTYPFDTWLEVKNIANGKTVIVRVNDRGPFIEGRIIDLSLGAAKAIDMVNTGIQEVEIQIIR